MQEDITGIEILQQLTREERSEFMTKLFLCRYLYQHRYNLTLTELIERIDSPLVKSSMEGWAYRDLEDWPSPQDYLHMLGTGMRLFSFASDQTSSLLQDRA